MWRTFATRSTYCDSISWLEKLGLNNRVVDFRFEDVEETFFADLLTSLGAFEDRAGLSAESAEFRGHGSLLAVGWFGAKLEAWGRVIERKRREFGA